MSSLDHFIALGIFVHFCGEAGSDKLRGERSKERRVRVASGLFTLLAVFRQADGKTWFGYLDHARLPHFDRRRNRSGEDPMRAKARGDLFLIADTVLKAEKRWRKHGSDRGQFVKRSCRIVAFDGEHNEVVCGRKRLSHGRCRADRSDRLYGTIRRVQLQTARLKSRGCAGAAD